MIKAVFFDIDNTLYNYEKANEKAMSVLQTYCMSRFPMEEEQFTEDFRNAIQEVQNRVGRNCAAVHNRLIRFQCMLEKWKKPLFPYALEMYHSYWDTLLEQMHPEPGIKEFLKRLKAEQKYIGCGTDMTAYIQYKKLEKLNIAQLIDGIVTSEEAGAEKPDPKLFHLCLKKAQVKPEECVFIGDSLKKDVLGAEKAGIKGIWYCPGRDPDPNYTCIQSYKECLKRKK